MINELIILLTDQQQAELVKRTEASDLNCDLEYLQFRINNWLKPERDSEHTEK